MDSIERNVKDQTSPINLSSQYQSNTVTLDQQLCTSVRLHISLRSVPPPPYPHAVNIQPVLASALTFSTSPTSQPKPHSLQLQNISPSCASHLRTMTRARCRPPEILLNPKNSLSKPHLSAPQRHRKSAHNRQTRNPTPPPSSPSVAVHPTNLPPSKSKSNHSQ